MITMISVELNEYRRLIEQDQKLNIIMEALLSSATLNYRKDGLVFNDSLVSAVVKGLDPLGFKFTVDRLQVDETAKKEAE
jgi:hypothetical protein